MAGGGTGDRQTAIKVDRLEQEVQQCEDELKACNKATALIAGHLGLEVDLTPIPSDREIRDATDLLAHPHLTMPTPAEAAAWADTVLEEARREATRRKPSVDSDEADQPPS